MPFYIEGNFRCGWVRENNGVIQSMWVPAGHETRPDKIVMFNMPRENGVPELGDFLSLTGKSGHMKGGDVTLHVPRPHG